MAELDDLKKELELTRQAAEANLAGWKRAKADYINLEREVDRNRSQWAQRAALDMVEDLLPLWVSFEKLVESLPSDLTDAWVTGVRAQYKLLVNFFSRQGVTKIETVGVNFDPQWHEAVGREKKEGVAPDVIIREVSPGFKMHDKLILPPKVILAE